MLHCPRVSLDCRAQGLGFSQKSGRQQFDLVFVFAGWSADVLSCRTTTFWPSDRNRERNRYQYLRTNIPNRMDCVAVKRGVAYICIYYHI